MNRPAAPPSERAIDQTLSQWVLARTGSPLLALAARAASTAEGLGHSCAWLVDPRTDAGFDHDALTTLRQHPWVGDGSRFTPFVIDAQDRFYLWRNWQHEARLAENILERCRRRKLPVATDVLADDLSRLFPAAPSAADDWQRAAVAAVPGARFFVLTGGPGTGKTTTVVRMLLMLLRHAAACGLHTPPSIALAAPTGKAAQRLVQAVAKGKAELLAAWPSTEENAFRELLPSIPHAEAKTLHRLLGYRPTDNTFTYDRHNPLALDIVVVDEASMVDLAMMRQLLDALRPDALLILLGDPNQLASVDAGSVLGDIVAGFGGDPAAPHAFPPALGQRLAPLLHDAAGIVESDAPLSGHVLTLTHTWRAGSGLQRSVDALRHAPDPAWLAALLAQRSDGDLHLRHCHDAVSLRTCADGWLEHHLEKIGVLLATATTPVDALRTLYQLQIVCALRDGAFGAAGMNAMMARRIGTRFDIDTSHAWYHGRPLIITRNDYARGLFNGDIGIALDDGNGLRVWFELRDRDGGAGLRSFSPRSLPPHESAWAITIHRSQGSEYDSVAVVLPPDDSNRLLTRELVYTAVSRARKHAEIWTTDASLLAALAQPIARQGGLQEKLQNARWRGKSD